MEKNSLNFLKELIGVSSPSGFEMHIQDRIEKRMSKYCDRTRWDVHGNVIGILNEKAPFRLMLSGHCDEIGLMISHIDDKGFVYFVPVGGVDPSVVTARSATIHSAQGPITGVIGRKAIHLMDNDERGKPVKMKDLWIDIGARNKKSAEKWISVGDYVTLDSEFHNLKNDLVAGRAFDDRAGAFVVVETLRLLKGKKLNVAIHAVSSVQEEIGLRGAHTSAYGIDPHVGIAIDVGHASDVPNGDPKLVGECHLGKGVQLHRGPNINPVLGAQIEQVAKKNKIPFQISAAPRGTGTDANAIQLTRSGVAAALISIPNRYMHTPVEVISLKDLENASKLLAKVIENMKPPFNYTPVLMKKRPKA